MDKIQALEETIELWSVMADLQENSTRKVYKSEIDGPWLFYAYCCPCCEYAVNQLGDERGYMCNLCPMKSQWEYFSRGRCYLPGSPYYVWATPTAVGDLIYDVEFFCRLIVELAQEALDELKRRQNEGS